MKKIIIVLMFMLTLGPAVSAQYVEGYFKKNGTYVAPHYKADPDTYKYTPVKTPNDYRGTNYSNTFKPKKIKPYKPSSRKYY